jgi:Tol biopolymer transport system component
MAFTRGRELVVRSVDSGEERVLFTSPPGDGPGGLSWLQDGAGLVFSHFTHGTPERQLARVDLRTGEYRHLVPLNSGTFSGLYELSPDNKTAYSSVRGGTPTVGSLVALDLVTGGLRSVVTLPHGGLSIYRAAVSPDGRTLAMEIRSLPVAEGELRIAVVGADGTGYREIFGPAAVPIAPGGLDWTRDGLIRFTLTTADGQFRIMSLKPDGGAPVFTGVEIDPSFRFARIADGSVFLAKRVGRSRLMRIGPTGGVPVDTGVELDEHDWFTVSPDGLHVAIQTFSGAANDELWSLDLASLISRR